MAERLASDIARDLRVRSDGLRIAEPWPALSELLAEAADKLEGLITLLAAAETARDAARQALWDVYATLGFDTDGTSKPLPDTAMSPPLADLVVAAAHEYREQHEVGDDRA